MTKRFSMDFYWMWLCLGLAGCAALIATNDLAAHDALAAFKDGCGLAGNTAVAAWSFCDWLRWKTNERYA